MLKRWNVHQGSQDLGLMTAKEIREALRRGSLDPFDKVSAEGSNIREDLVEVDEIFKEDLEESAAVASKPVAEEAQPTADGAKPLGFSAPKKAKSRTQSPIPSPVAQSAPFKIEVQSPAQGLKAKSIVHEAVEEAPRTDPPADPNMFAPSWRNPDTASLAAAKDDSKSTQKRYYLIDKSKILGPVSALEIQSLFNRGGMNEKVKVQRIGGTKAIPISQFISSFSEDRIKELTEDGKLNQKVSSPSSKVLNELARAANAQKIAKSRQNKSYLVFGLGAVLLGIFLLILFESSTTPKRQSESADREGKKSRPKLLQKAQTDNDEEDRKPREATQPKRAEKPAASPAKQSRSSPTPKAAKAAKPATARQAARVAESRPAPQKVAVVKPRAPEPTPIPVPVKKVSPIERAMNSGGGVQTVGPLNFSMTALESCPSKCNLILRDSSGVSIKAIFFKSAYYDQLKRNPNNVFVSGSMRKEGSNATILIQDVR